MTVWVRLLTAGLGLAAVPGSAANVAEWGAGFAQPTISGQGVEGAGQKLSFGHMELTLSGGRLVPVTVLDQVVGAYFVGNGSARYVSAAADEAEVFRQNVDKATSWKVDPEHALTVPFEGALIIVSAGGEKLGGDPAWLGGAAAAGMPEKLAAHIAAFSRDYGWRYDEAMPQAMVEAPSEPLVLIQLETGKKDLVYVRDTLRHLDEDLFVVEEIQSGLSVFKDRRSPDLLSEQTVGRERLDPRPLRYRLVDVDGSLTNPDGISAEVKVSEIIEARQPIRTLSFRFATTHIGTVGATSRVVENPVVLTAVTDGDGRPLSYWHKEGGLTVELPRTLKAGERFTLRFEFGGDFLFRPFGDNYWDLGDSWFPTPPRRDMEGYTYHAVVKVRKPFQAFSSGSTVRRWEEGEHQCAEFRSEKPIQGAALLAGKYTTFVQEKNGKTVRVSAYGLNKPDAMKKLASLTLSFIEFYEPLLGEYPWKELDVIEINNYGFGVAPPGVIYITKEAFVAAPMDEVANAFKKGINARMAHEVAHAWWGNATMLGSSEENWMWEATAEYYSAVAMGALKKKGDFQLQADGWERGAKKSNDRSSVLLANQIAGDDAYEHRVQLLYDKGPWVLHALRQELGDEVFFTILKSFQRNFRGKPAYTKDLIDIASFIAKRDLKPFFARYVSGMEMPEKKGK